MYGIKMDLLLMQVVCLYMIGCASGNIVQYVENKDSGHPQASGPHLRGTAQGYAYLQDGIGDSGTWKTFDTPPHLDYNGNTQEFARRVRETVQENTEAQTANQIYKFGEALQQEAGKVNSGFSQAINGNGNYNQQPNSQDIQQVPLSDSGSGLSDFSGQFSDYQQNISDQSENLNRGSTSYINNQEDKQQVFQNQRTSTHEGGVREIINVRTQTNVVNQRPINHESTIIRGENNDWNPQPFKLSINPNSNLRIKQDESRQLSNFLNRRQSSILSSNQRNPVSSVDKISEQIILRGSSNNDNPQQNTNNQDINQKQVYHHASGPHLRGGSLTRTSQLPPQTYSRSAELKVDQTVLSPYANTNNQQRDQQSSSQGPLQLRPDSTLNLETYDTEQEHLRTITGDVNFGTIQIPIEIGQNDVNPEVIRTQRQTNLRTTRRTNVNRLIKNQQRVPTQSVSRRQDLRNNVPQQPTNSIRTQQRGIYGNTPPIKNQGSTRQLDNIRAQRQGVIQNLNQQRNQGGIRQFNNQVQGQSRLRSSAIQSNDVRLVPKDSFQDVLPIIPVSDNLLGNNPTSSAVQRAVASQRAPTNTGNQRFRNIQSGIRSQQTATTSRQSNSGQGQLRCSTFGDAQGRQSNNANQQNLQRPEQNIVNVEDIRDGPHSDGSYYFRITNSDGTIREEGGVALDPCTIRVTGSYQYRHPNGELVTTQFMSDQNGYQSFPAGTSADWIPPVRQPIAPPMMMGPMPPCPSGKYQGGNGDGATSAINGQRPLVVIPTQTPRPRPRPVITPQPVRKPAQTPRPFVPATPRPFLPVTPRPFVPARQTPRPFVPARQTPRPFVPAQQTPRPFVPTRRPQPITGVNQQGGKPNIQGGMRPVSPPITAGPVGPSRPTVTNFNNQINDNSNIPPGGSVININTQNNDNRNSQPPGGNILNFNTQNNQDQQGFGNNGPFNFNSQNNNNG